MNPELKKYNIAFNEKIDTNANYLPMWESLYNIDEMLKECDYALDGAGLCIGYESIQSDVDKLGEQLNILQEFITCLPIRISELIDTPFKGDMDKASGILSHIHLDEFSVDNSVGYQYYEYDSAGNKIKQTKSSLTFKDFLGNGIGSNQDGLEASNKYMNMFKEGFKDQYNSLVKQGRLEGSGIDSLYDYQKFLNNQGEFYMDTKNFGEKVLSLLYDATVIIPIIEICTRRDAVTGDFLTDGEVTMKAITVAFSITELGSVINVAKSAGNLTFRQVAMLSGKTMAVNFGTNLSTTSVESFGEECGLPKPITLALSIGTGLMTQHCMNSILFGKLDNQAISQANNVSKGGVSSSIDDVIEGGSKTVDDVTIKGLKIIDDKVDGKIPTSLYEKYQVDSVHNPGSDTMTLGKYEPTILADGTKDFSIPGPGAYTVKAGDTTYFSLGTEWDTITETYNLDKAGKNMFDYFNKPALDDAVKNNKIIRFSHNPESYGDCALKWEWDYLQEQHGYFALEKEGDFWYATR